MTSSTPSCWKCSEDEDRNRFSESPASIHESPAAGFSGEGIALPGIGEISGKGGISREDWGWTVECEMSLRMPVPPPRRTRLSNQTAGARYMGW